MLSYAAMPIMLFWADDAADSPVAPGVRDPLVLVLSRLDGGSVCDGTKVLSMCVEDAEDSLAESGFVGCLAATVRVSILRQ